MSEVCGTLVEHTTSDKKGTGLRPEKRQPTHEDDEEKYPSGTSMFENEQAVAIQMINLFLNTVQDMINTSSKTKWTKIAPQVFTTDTHFSLGEEIRPFEWNSLEEMLTTGKPTYGEMALSFKSQCYNVWSTPQIVGTPGISSPYFV